MKFYATALIISSLLSCGYSDDNDVPRYGKDNGLPLNCRAYVQATIDGYRNKEYSADDAMTGLQRNCGINGQSWKSNR